MTERLRKLLKELGINVITPEDLKGKPYGGLGIKRIAIDEAGPLLNNSHGTMSKTVPFTPWFRVERRRPL